MPPELSSTPKTNSSPLSSESAPAVSAIAEAFAEVKSSPGPTTASVSFANLKEGDIVKSPFKVVMQVEGMEVRPAGKEFPKSGHHHIIVDGGPVAENGVVPADEKHLHFGKGQTETELTLEKGEHTLTLQFADYAHRSYGPDLSKTIKIRVE